MYALASNATHHAPGLQASDAYEQRMAKQAALAYAERDRHRAELEASMSPGRQQRVLEAAEQLVAQCITLAGAPPQPCSTACSSTKQLLRACYVKQ